MEEQRSPPVLHSVLVYGCTAGVVLVVGWAFGVGGDLRALSSLPGRVTTLEQRINQLERDNSGSEEARAFMKERIERLQAEVDRLRKAP
jgi:hypothetical protein